MAPLLTPAADAPDPPEVVAELLDDVGLAAAVLLELLLLLLPQPTTTALVAITKSNAHNLFIRTSSVFV